ncbi:cytochrome c3 family protein [Sunxiuqinia sp. sy24]
MAFRGGRSVACHNRTASAGPVSLWRDGAALCYSCTLTIDGGHT